MVGISEHPMGLFCSCLPFVFALSVFVSSQITGDVFKLMKRSYEHADKNTLKLMSCENGKKAPAFSACNWATAGSVLPLVFSNTTSSAAVNLML